MSQHFTVKRWGPQRSLSRSERVRQIWERGRCPNDRSLEGRKPSDQNAHAEWVSSTVLHPLVTDRLCMMTCYIRLTRPMEKLCGNDGMTQLLRPCMGLVWQLRDRTWAITPMTGSARDRARDDEVKSGSCRFLVGVEGGYSPLCCWE